MIIPETSDPEASGKQPSARRFFAFRLRFLVRLILALIAVTVLVGVAAPFVNADAYRGRIQSALEETLGRKIEIGKVHFSLFTGPGFTLDQVTIQDDPRYGLEPFAYIPTLEARVRLDKLLIGQIRPLGLRMIDASVNLVKNDDGSWNAVALVERLGAPRRAPLNFFPAVQISNGRIDFKLGTRKTTLYVTDTDLSIYPQSSGKIYFRFEGSPARTDRAGNGFGHLTGTANWYLQPAPVSGNQLEADVNLQPSNLSELATLFQGQDMGVHGNISAHVLISGPFSDLRALGDVRLEDVHRWDLLPSPGDNWYVRFKSQVNLETHKLEFSTLPLSATENPVMLQFHANDFMTHPSWSVLATLQKAPLASLLPLGRRMGMALPAGLRMDGSLDGVVGFSNVNGLEGGLVITNAVANIPNLPPLRSATANVTISASKIHIDPAILQSDSGGTLSAGGAFDLVTQNMTADISADNFSAAAFKQTTNAWFGSPDALAIVVDGDLSGHFLVSFPSDASAQSPPLHPSWTGQAQLTDATLNVPGVSAPVTQMQGKASIDDSTFDLPRFSAVIDKMPFTGSYRYATAARHTEHLRLEFQTADLAQLEAALSPTLGDNGLLSRFRFTRRAVPPWLLYRNMEGEVIVSKCSVNQLLMGPLSTHFIWQGTSVQLSNLQLGLPGGGKLLANGEIALAARLPRYQLNYKVRGYPFNNSLLNADGSFDTSGFDTALLQHLQTAGQFTSDNLLVPPAVEPLSNVSGRFTFVFNDATPLLKLTKVTARQNDEDWTGDGGTAPDGKIHLDLTSGDRQLHVAADPNPAPVVPVMALPKL